MGIWLEDPPKSPHFNDSLGTVSAIKQAQESDTSQDFSIQVVIQKWFNIAQDIQVLTLNAPKGINMVKKVVQMGIWLEDPPKKSTF